MNWGVVVVALWVFGALLFGICYGTNQRALSRGIPAPLLGPMWAAIALMIGASAAGLGLAL